MGVQISDDVPYLGVIQYLAEGGHRAASVLKHVLDTLIVGGGPAGQELLVEQTFQRWALRGHAAVRLMALLAIRYEEFFPTQFICREWTAEPLAVLFAS